MPKHLPDLDAEDERAIERIVHSVGRALDNRDFVALGELFTVDATVVTPGGQADGRAALVAQARRSHEHVPGLQHCITDVLIGSENAGVSASANLVATFADGVDDPAPMQIGGVYRMQLVRDDGKWRIARMSTTPVWARNRKPR